MEFLEQAFPYVEIAIAHGKVIVGLIEFALSSGIDRIFMFIQSFDVKDMNSYLHSIYTALSSSSGLTCHFIFFGSNTQNSLRKLWKDLHGETLEFLYVQT